MASTQTSRGYHIHEPSLAASQNRFKDTLVLENDPIPSLGPHDVLLQIHAVSLNWRDIMIATGTYHRVQQPNVVPCSDGAGIITQIGPQVTRFKSGDRAAAIFAPLWLTGLVKNSYIGQALGGDRDGMLRQYAVFNEEVLVHLPSHLSFEEAATLPCAGVTAWNALFGHGPDRGVGRTLRAGETVVTQGTGGVSLFAAQFGHAAGVDVISTTSSEAKAEKIRNLIGVDKIINYKETPTWAEEVKKLSSTGEGADLVVEVMGDVSTLTQSYACAKGEAQISVIGTRSKWEDKNRTGTTKQVEEMTMQNMLSHAVSTRRILVGSRQQFEDMNKFIEKHQIRPIVDQHIFEFEEAREAFVYLLEGRQFGNIVVRIKH